MGAGRKTVTLTKLAGDLGVSASTISRVLNGYEQGFSVTPKVRARILRAVAESGYRANPFVRSLRTKRTMMVAWLDYKFGSPGGINVDEGALEWMVRILAGEGYSVSSNFLSEEEPEQYFPQWPVDGVAIADVADPARLERLAAAGLPHVSVNGVAGSGGCSAVVDERQCGQLLYGYLGSLGHTRIAYYNKQSTGRLVRHYSVAQRHEAYVSHLHGLGAEPLSGHDRHDLSPAEFLRMAYGQGRATVVVAYDHFHAVRLLGEALRQGIRVPGQLGIVCYNDLFPLSDLMPAMTCVATPAEGLGRAAAALLLGQMGSDGTAAGETLRIPGSLTVRESVAPIGQMLLTAGRKS